MVSLYCSDCGCGKCQLTAPEQVNKVDGAGELFSNPFAPNNWCLILVDPVPRQVTYYYHSTVGFM